MSTAPVSSESRSFAYAPGDMIAGKYALEEVLGSGGMGAVFRAKNTLLDMPVAIKLIRADLDREVLSGRLLQEARAAAKLSHPAIVRVFDVGRTALGDPFIVMELLSGESLGRLLDRENRLSSARAVQLLLPIADALSAANAKGFVHRDVKPDNVFIAVDDDGQLQPKLVDFGIVKHEQTGPESQLTQIGSVVGSPDYMSPEQARGSENLDQRSDVWSFSVVLYESICGRAPFEAKNYHSLLRMILETEPLSLAQQSAADAELSAIVSKGMSKAPGERWGSLGQMGRALASWLHDQGFGEDACGLSLEARWLSRSTDPSSPGRASRSSLPDSWPAPASGVRTVAEQLGTAATVELARSAGTPLSLARASTRARPRGRSLYWVGAALLLLAGTLLLWLGQSRSPATSSSPAPPSVARVGDVTAEPPAVVSAPPEPVAPAPEVSATPSTPPAEPRPATAAAKPAVRTPPKRRPVASPSRKPVIELLAPY